MPAYGTHSQLPEAQFTNSNLKHAPEPLQLHLTTRTVVTSLRDPFSFSVEAQYSSGWPEQRRQFLHCLSLAIETVFKSYSN